VTTREYDLIEQYRDAGGNLIFLSANNFFRRVVERNGVLTRLAPWRDLGRPEAALIGVQYRERRGTAAGAVRRPRHGGDSVALAGTRARSRLVARAGRRRVWGGDRRHDARLAARYGRAGRDPDLLGPGLTAQMTYYSTPAGAQVFSAGALDFVGSALTYPVNHLLLDLWRRLAVP
jgi:hypothetical protein